MIITGRVVEFVSANCRPGYTHIGVYNGIDYSQISTKYIFFATKNNITIRIIANYAERERETKCCNIQRYTSSRIDLEFLRATREKKKKKIRIGNRIAKRFTNKVTKEADRARLEE